MNHGYMVMTQKQSSSVRNGRRHPLCDRKKCAKFTATSSLCWSFFWDIQGIVHKEFVPPGQTVNGEFYCEVLRRPRENVGRKRPEMWKNGNWLLHHDNVPAHTSLVVREFLTKRTWPLLPTLPTHLTWPHVIATCSLKWNSGWKGGISSPSKRSKQNRNRY